MIGRVEELFERVVDAWRESVLMGCMCLPPVAVQCLGETSPYESFKLINIAYMTRSFHLDTTGTHLQHATRNIW